MRVLVMLAPALLLAGCGSNDGAAGDAGDGGGTQISIEGGNGFSAGLGKDGKVAIDMPGLKARLDLPDIQLDADDFDIDGVSLPTGSRIATMNVADSRDRDGAVKVSFTSPAGTAAVREWFQGKLAAKGFRLSAKGDNLTGTTADGKAFSLTTKAKGDGASESVLSVGK